jgi:hypothetical protein
MGEREREEEREFMSQLSMHLVRHEWFNERVREEGAIGTHVI